MKYNLLIILLAAAVRIAHGGSSELPTRYDLRDVLGSKLNPARNQGMCGSTWAISATDAMEIAVALEQDVQVQLSAQQLVSCEKGSHGCSGGYMAPSYTVTHGISLEKDYPYQGIGSPCREVPAHTKAARWVRLSESGTPDVSVIKKAVLEHGAVTVSVNASNWGDYKGGIFDRCENRSINHTVNIIGWDNPTRTWIIRNMWGTHWGEKGYMQITWNCNQIGFDAYYVEIE